MSDTKKQTPDELLPDTATTVPGQTDTTLRLTDTMLKDLGAASADNETVPPVKPLCSEQLEIDEFLVDRLTTKPPEKYKFRRSIARGGMKMVIQVKDKDTTRDVAMALLPNASARPPADILRFVQEARLTASLEHPNIVPVHDIGIDGNGSPYFTMKLLHGQTLAALLTRLNAGDIKAKEAYPEERLLRIFLKICYGMAFAHSKGVIHLDLKPENIQLGDFGEVLIMDWGLARMISEKKADDSAPDKKHHDGDFPYLTMDGVMKGTPGYMAPEQAAGQNSKKDKRTDIYSLGAILYAMITWQNPIEKKPIPDMISDTLAGNIIAPHLRVPDREISVALEAVVMKAMSTAPEDRYASVRELRDEVNAYLGGYATRAERANVFKQTLLWLKRHAILSVAAAFVLFFLAAQILYSVHEFKSRNPAWISTFSRDFTVAGKQKWTGMTFCNINGDNVSAWKTDRAGLIMQPGEWLWIDVPLNPELKMKLSVILEEPDASLDICLASDFPAQQCPAPNAIPYGYLIQIHAGTADNQYFDSILKNAAGSVSPARIAVGKSVVRPKSVTRLEVERTGGLIKVSLPSLPDHLPPDEFMPFLSAGEHRIGFHTSGKVRLLDLEISTKRLPVTPTLLIAGDSLAEAGAFFEAYGKYLRIADENSNNTISGQALLRAYRIAAWCLPAEKSESARLEVKRRIARQTDFPYALDMLEIDSGLLWQCGRFAEALELAEQVLAQNPNSRILAKLLSCRRTPLPRNIRDTLLCYVRSCPHLHNLDLSGIGIESQDELTGLDDRFVVLSAQKEN